MPTERTAAAGGNDRITVALLVQRLDTLIVRLEKLDEKLGKYIETNDIKSNLTNLEIERLKGLLEERYDFANIVARSEKMRRVLEMVSQIAKTDSTVYIHGESGTGKELIAKAIHLASERAGRPLHRGRR